MNSEAEQRMENLPQLNSTLRIPLYCSLFCSLLSPRPRRNQERAAEPLGAFEPDPDQIPLRAAAWLAHFQAAATQTVPESSGFA